MLVEPDLARIKAMAETMRLTLFEDDEEYADGWRANIITVHANGKPFIEYRVDYWVDIWGDSYDTPKDTEDARNLITDQPIDPAVAEIFVQAAKGKP